MMLVRLPLAAAIACIFVIPVAHAEGQILPEVVAAPVVVTATRTEQNSFDLPVSIDTISAEQIQEGQLQVNISENLARVPGIVAQSRGQYAQDIQISSRGFGARSQFGVRGIRLYADGIPLTMPDGQGQAGTFDLGSAQRIEVMRGPFSALYGNSSGGVVQIFTADGPREPALGAAFTAGSYGTQRTAVKLGGTSGSINYLGDYSHFESDGYRDHSSVRRDLFNAKAAASLNEDTRITAIVTDLEQPLSQDPQGVTKAQWQSNPKQVVASTLFFNTRVDRRHTQAGVRLEHDVNDDDTLSFMGYGGTRKNVQFQSIGANAAGNGVTTKTVLSTSKSSGGVAQIDRDFGGSDLRFTHKGMLAGGLYSLTVGTNYDTMTDDRTGYDNFIALAGASKLCGIGVICGVKGNLRRDEDDTAWNFDQYAQAEWSSHERWNLVAGVRHSDVHIKSEDHYLSNGDDSGSVSYAKTTPVVGVLYKLNETVNLYANAGKGFETPTMIEMAYSPGGGGFNFNLKPATSNNYEIGTKAFLGQNTRMTLAIFKTDTDHEIVVAGSTGGRSSYQNAGGTERKGAELVVDSVLGSGFTTYASYAYLDARYSERFCSGSISATCVGGTYIASGKLIPGTYRHTAYAELAWKHAPSSFTTALEMRANSKVYVSDTNAEHAPGYAIINWRGGFEQSIRQWQAAEFVRVENLFDRTYVGSIRINDSNGQYYEPSPGTNWLLGVKISYRF